MCLQRTSLLSSRWHSGLPLAVKSKCIYVPFPKDKNLLAMSFLVTGIQLPTVLTLSDLWSTEGRDAPACRDLHDVS